MTAVRHLTSLLPTREDYRSVPRTWRGDLVAGITVAIIALPLALAFGVSSGAGAASGLVTAIVAGLVAAVFGGSNVQVSGPTGAMVVVLGPIVAAHGTGAIAVVSLMAGAIVVVGGLLHLGRVVSYIPWPVIEGFTLGIAVIIFAQQVPAAVGTPAGESTIAVVAAAQALTHAGGSTALWPLVAVAVVAVVMVLAPRWHPQLPGSIVGIVVVTVLAGASGVSLARIGVLPSSLPAPALPEMTTADLTALLGPACAVAVLAAVESLLSARVAASMADSGRYDADRELVGQGIASIASGMFGGMPATGAIARTAVNVRSGGRTRLAAIVHVAGLLAVVYLAAGVVSHIPLAALSGVLMVTACRMVSRSTVRSVLGSSRSDAVVFVVTAAITISFDLIVAVGIGIAVAAFFALRTLARSGMVHREPLPGAPCAEDVRIALFRLDGALFFGAADRMHDAVTEIDDVAVVILRMSQLQTLDATGARVVTEMIQTLERRGVTVLVKGIQPHHQHLADAVGVVASLTHRNHLFVDLDEAVAHARAHAAHAPSAHTHAAPTTCPTPQLTLCLTEDFR